MYRERVKEKRLVRWNLNTRHLEVLEEIDVSSGLGGAFEAFGGRLGQELLVLWLVESALAVL